MITDFFLQLFRGFINGMISILPTSSGFPLELKSSLVSLFQNISGLDFFLPISELFLVLGLFIVFELSMQLVHFTFWIIKVIRGHG